MEREINFYFPNHLSSLTFYEQKKGKQRRTDTHGNSRTERGFERKLPKHLTTGTRLRKTVHHSCLQKLQNKEQKKNCCS